ncbi:Histidine kinase [Rhynchospora pubera]|uniref:histidine kinase n=1 Tax=Rhynchospora pubera TaxID=906938 RepID=A0AAV8BYC2_9POAL|nr:Histidine kinase [Rhynchospora pubera]
MRVGGKVLVSVRKKRWWLNRTALMVLWVFVSGLIWVGLHLYSRGDSMRKAEENLVSMCNDRARMLQDQFAVSVNHFQALAILISTFHYEKHPSVLDQDTFAYYTAKTALERPLLNGVAYAQRVLRSEREAFERRQGWTIKSFEGTTSPEKEEYAAVIYSQETVSYIEALDMMSGEEDHENILKARATGKAVLTNPFRLLGSNHLGVVLTFAVYRSGLPKDATLEQRIEATLGYLGGAFDVESLVENLLRQLAGNQDIVVNVYDVTNATEPLIMYGPQSTNSYQSPSHVSVLDFGDPFRKHEMKCRYRQKVPIPLSAITTPSGVFVICMLAGYILFAAWSRYDSVKEDWRKSEELKLRAEAADLAKSQFLATVSHEIRTPMNGVLGMLDMLLDTDLNLIQRDCAQTARVCGKALISLMNEVLDREKIESGKLELEAVPFDLRFLLDDVLSLFSSKSREKGIELAVFVSDNVPQVVIGDPGRFRQVITNLVGNSVKFTKRGHIFVQVHLAGSSYQCIRVSEEVESLAKNIQDKMLVDTFNYTPDTLSGLEAADRTNNWENFRLLLNEPCSGLHASEHVCKWTSNKVTLVVSVEDTGIGIPVHAQDRVFTPFMQVDSSASRMYGGTGIGLSISKYLVELMGGQISFVSRPHVGSTFTFTAMFQQDENIKFCDLHSALVECLPDDLRGMNAFLIDGRPVRSSVTRYHLKRLGIRADVATNIRTALHSISGQNDLQRTRKQLQVLLVERDAWDLETYATLLGQLEELKQKGLMSETPKTILLSTSELNRAELNLYFDMVITKPLRSSTLAACLQNILGLKDTRSLSGKEKENGAASALNRLLYGKKILVVDDNKVNLMVAAGSLKKYGANVVCVERGRDALAFLRLPHDFDACFMDIQMPEMDGFEATRQIRLMENNEKFRSLGPTTLEHSGWSSRRLPVLAMTADVIQATYEECIKWGMDGYISKPFDEEQLYQAISRSLVSNSNACPGF